MHDAAPKKKLPGRTSLCRPGNRHIRVGIPPSPCASCAVWVPAMLPALGRMLFRHPSPSRVWMPPSWWIRANPSALRPCVPPPCGCRGCRLLPGCRDRRRAGRDPSCTSAPWYGCRYCPPGRFRRGRHHGPHRHPSPIPFDRCCPYPFHPCQVLDPEERSVLSPVRDDRLGLLGPHVRQSLLQRRRIGGIDVDAVGRKSRSRQQKSQRKRLPRKPRPHRVAPCDLDRVLPTSRRSNQCPAPHTHSLSSTSPSHSQLNT